MILTGKCNEDFVNFRLDKFSHVEFIDLPIFLQNALIIEWFDSVGIYVSLNYVSFYDELRNDKGFESYVTNNGLSVKFRSLNSRQEATEQAIIHANKIYNENKI